jgi:hypothetical protein
MTASRPALGQSSSQSPKQNSSNQRNSENQKKENVAPLKNVLEDVMKHQPPPKPKAPELKEALASVQNVPPSTEVSSKPFEVPEETLRALFKEQ